MIQTQGGEACPAAPGDAKSSGLPVVDGLLRDAENLGHLDLAAIVMRRQRIDEARVPIDGALPDSWLAAGLFHSGNLSHKKKRVNLQLTIAEDK